MHQAQRRRKRRRFKPLRRLLLIAVICMLIYGVFSMGRYAYSVAFAPRIRYTTVKALDQSFYKGRAIVIRDELSIAAPKGGVLNILIEGQSKVKSGQQIFEVVDQSLLSSIDKQLADEAEKILGKTSQTDDAIQFKKDQLAGALNELRQLSTRYATLLNQKEAREAKQVFDELTVTQNNVRKLQGEYDFYTRSQDQYEAKRQELLSQRSMAITAIAAPLHGVVSYRTDGLEARLKISDLASFSLDMLRQMKGEQALAENGDKLNAGQAVATVINDAEIVLVLEGKSFNEVSDDIEVEFAGTAMSAVIAAKTPTSQEGVHMLALKIQTPPIALLEQRVVEVALRSKGETLVSLPKSAVWEDQHKKTYVYVYANEGEHVAKEVFLRQASGKSIIAAGLEHGDTIVINPKLIQQKEASNASP